MMVKLPGFGNTRPVLPGVTFIQVKIGYQPYLKRVMMLRVIFRTVGKFIFGLFKFFKKIHILIPYSGQ